MSEERIRRIGENEALYRQVNEQVRGINRGASALPSGEFSVLCECGTLDCMQHIVVSRTVYEETRSNSHRFMVLPDHQIDELEVVVADHGSFVVLEKTPPQARRIAEEMDPRT